MTTSPTPVECPPGTHSMFDPCPGDCADPLPDDEPLPPHGPGAARQVAEQLAADGEHSHLVHDGMTDCLTGECVLTDPDDGRWLL